MAAGIPRPSLWEIPTPEPNAFATGLHPGAASVSLTTGLLGLLDHAQLRAVMAHEVGHIALGHIGQRTELARRLASGATLTGAAVLVLGGAMADATEGTDDDMLVGFLAVAAASAAERQAVRRLYAEQRAQEHEADDVACLLGGSSAALHSALGLIQARVDTPAAQPRPDWIRLLGFTEPEDQLATHPPLQARVQHGRPWKTTEHVASWCCQQCGYGEDAASSFCRRCARPRPNAAMGVGVHDCSQASPADARYCTLCGTQVRTLDLGAIQFERTPTCLGLPPRRPRAAPVAQLPSSRGIDSPILRRRDRFALGAAVRQLTTVLASLDEPPLALAPAVFATAHGTKGPGVVALTPSWLVAANDHRTDQVAWADVTSIAPVTEVPGMWHLEVWGRSTWIQPGDSEAGARARCLLRQLFHHRQGAHATASW